ncbi:MAG: RNA polymerase sigma factor [Dictyoglomaceae bacterium]|nr:RNA polymerase sigma factor [Dictyoglomaceae bacterium]HPP16252.1 RNA polymerase sigma factor [Dictyoglomaceae bacterium]HPU43460.1 RNA polymerase sigma factor [Dictyoglomaceae bacterium]
MGDISFYFEKYGEEIYRYLRRLTRDEETAKDLLQETFLRAMRSSVDDEKAKNYLFRIAHNLAIDYFNETKRFVDVPLDGEESPGNAYEIMENKDIWKPLELIEKSILILYYQEGYSYKEISEKLDIPLNTVKSHVFRAKKKIYNYLKGEK